MDSKTEFISIIINILSHYERIKNQRMLGDFGDVLSYYLGYPVISKSKDSIKAHFISFYYKRRLREIKKIIDDHYQLLEENIGNKRLDSFILNIRSKIKSKVPDLLEYYSVEDEEIERFFDFLETNYAGDIEKYQEISKENFKKERKVLNQAAKRNPNQEGFNF